MASKDFAIGRGNAVTINLFKSEELGQIGTEEATVADIVDGTKVTPHGLFYMENAKERDASLQSDNFAGRTDDERDASCFALEEEKGEHWRGRGATGLIINEARSTL